MPSDYFMRKYARRGIVKRSRREEIDGWKVLGLVASFGIALCFLNGIVGSFIYYFVFRLNVFNLFTIDDYLSSSVDRIFLVVFAMSLAFLAVTIYANPVKRPPRIKIINRIISWPIFWPLFVAMSTVFVGINGPNYLRLGLEWKDWLTILVLSVLLLIISLIIYKFRLLSMIFLAVGLVQWLLTTGIRDEDIQGWATLIFVFSAVLAVIVLWVSLGKRKAISINKRRHGDIIIMLPVIALVCIGTVSLMDAFQVEKGKNPVLLRCTKDNQSLHDTIFVGASSRYNFFYHKDGKNKLGLAVPNSFVKAHVYNDTSTIIGKKEIKAKGYVVVDCKYLPPSVTGQDGDI